MADFIINAFADESSSELLGQIEAMKRNNLQGIEIRNVNGKSIHSHTLEDIKEFGKVIEDNGFNVWSIGSALGKIKITDDFAPHLDEFKRTIEMAHILKADYIRLFSFYMPKDEDPTPYRDEVFERMSKFLEAAKGSGVKLCHENEKGIYGDIAPRCLEIHKAMPEFGCIFDPANYIQCGQDILSGWELLKDYVTYMHIKDATAEGKIVPAGKGIGCLPEVLKLYAAKGGKGLTVEPHLSIFKGLAGLEREGEKTQAGVYQYPTKEAAFDAAVAALREII
ncbi:MAG: sugar phosphate isomerase/epimerase [Clostridia bacterium]|nr:sugar phosphate isomerase/epimerase [Clostridia bacterium]